MMAAEHQPAFEQLMAGLDGELAPAEAAMVRAHVAGCRECQELEAELRDVTGRLATWTVSDPPISLRSPVASSRFARMRGWMPIAAALAIVVGAGGIWLERQRNEPAQPMAIAMGGIAMEEAQTVAPAPAAMKLSYAERAARGVAQDVGATPLLARTARLKLVVAAFDSARGEVDRIVAAAGGFAGDVTASDERGSPKVLTASLRVPEQSLDATLEQLKRLGRATIESRNAEDVTQQSADLNARLGNARISEKRLNEIVVNRTGSLEDVLNVEREIARVRGDIEEMEARRRTLDGRISYASIRLEMAEEQKAALDLGDQSISAKLRNALVGGWNSAFNSVLDFTLLIAWAAPTLLLWGLALIVPYRLLRRRFAG